MKIYFDTGRIASLIHSCLNILYNGSRRTSNGCGSYCYRILSVTSLQDRLSQYFFYISNLPLVRTQATLKAILDAAGLR